MAVNRDAEADRYRRALADVPDAILLLDDNGVIVDASTDAEDFLGYAMADVVGASAASFVHPDDLDRCAYALLEETRNPGWRAPALLVRIRNSDGSFRDIELLGHNRFDDPDIGGLLVSMRDVSGPGLGQRVIAVGDYLYRTFETAASDGVCIFDADGNRAYVSPSICQVLGYTTEELIAVGASGLVVAEDLDLWKHTVSAALRDPGHPHRVECRLHHKSRGPMWIETTVVNLLEDPAVRGVVTHIRDIDARRNAEIDLHRQSRLDPLTLLGNRMALMERLAVRSHGTRTLLFADLDNFKQVNNRFGHAEGDRVLQLVGAAIATVADGAHFVARNGGDEFCLVADGLDDEKATDLANAVRQVVLAAVSAHGVGISIGIGHIEASLDEGDEHLLAIADRDMYRHKPTGESPDAPPVERRTRVREPLTVTN